MPNLTVSPLSVLAPTPSQAFLGSAGNRNGMDFGQELQRATLANSSAKAFESPPAPAARESGPESQRETARDGTPEAVRERERARQPAKDQDQDQDPQNDAPDSATAGQQAGGEEAPAVRKRPAGRAAPSESSKSPAAPVKGSNAESLDAGKSIDLNTVLNADADSATNAAEPAADLAGTGVMAQSGLPLAAPLSATELSGSAPAGLQNGTAAPTDLVTGAAQAAGSAPAGAEPLTSEVRASSAATLPGAAEPIKIGANDKTSGPADVDSLQAEAMTGQEARVDALAEPAPTAAGASGTAFASNAAWLVEQRGQMVAGVATPTAGGVGDRSEPLVANIDAAIGSEGFAPALGARISVLARDGIEQARLNVHPAELGPIALRLAMDGTQVRVDMTADWGATRQALEQALPALAAALRDAGFTLAGGGVFQQAPQDRGAQQGQGDSAQPSANPLTQTDAFGTAAADKLLAQHRPRGLVDLIA